MYHDLFFFFFFFFLYSSLPTALIGTMGISKSRIKLSHTITCILHIHASHMPDGPLLGPLAQACTLDVCNNLRGCLGRAATVVVAF